MENAHRDGEESTSVEEVELSHEEEFILWMLEELRQSLPRNNQIVIINIIRTLERSNFLNDLSIHNPAIKFIVRSWEYITNPQQQQRYLADPNLAHYVPYAMLRIQEKMEEFIDASSASTAEH